MENRPGTGRFRLFNQPSEHRGRTKAARKEGTAQRAGIYPLERGKPFVHFPISTCDKGGFRNMDGRLLCRSYNWRNAFCGLEPGLPIKDSSLYPGKGTSISRPSAR